MKNTIRIISMLTLAFILIGALSSCALIDKYKKWEGNIVEVTEDSKNCVENFGLALAEADFDAAKTYLHPNSTPSADELEAYIEEIKTSHSFDLTKEPTFEFEGFDPEVNLEHVKYDIAAKATIGDEVLELRLGILKDEHGFGIYNITVD